MSAFLAYYIHLKDFQCGLKMFCLSSSYMNLAKLYKDPLMVVQKDRIHETSNMIHMF